MKLENQTILITSNEPWGDIWYSKQNYAYELSKKNKVFFINPPSKWKFLNLFYNPITISVYNENLKIITYQNFLPILNDLLNKWNNFSISKYLKYFLCKNEIKNYILWAFDPLRLYDYKKIGASLGIYHCVDYFYFKYLGETELCKNSSLIFATSQKFLDEFSSFKTPKHIVPHSISHEEFEINMEHLNKLKIDIDNYALYIGVIDSRINFDLLEKAIKQFSSIPFVFIGPLLLPSVSSAKRIFNMKLYPNVHILGPKHFKTLKYYINKSLFCISFMDMTYHANTVHHHKTLVYLAQGKPVFGPVFEEYKKLGNIMYMNNTDEGMLQLLDDFLQNGENENLVQERIKYARKYIFKNTLEAASKIIEEYTK